MNTGYNITINTDVSEPCYFKGGLSSGKAGGVGSSLFGIGSGGGIGSDFSNTKESSPAGYGGGGGSAMKNLPATNGGNGCFIIFNRWGIK